MPFRALSQKKQEKLVQESKRKSKQNRELRAENGELAEVKEELEGELEATTSELESASAASGRGRKTTRGILAVLGGAFAGRAFSGNAAPSALGATLKVVEVGTGSRGVAAEVAGSFGDGLMAGAAAIRARKAAEQKGAWLDMGGASKSTATADGA